MNDGNNIIEWKMEERGVVLMITQIYQQKSQTSAVHQSITHATLSIHPSNCQFIYLLALFVFTHSPTITNTHATSQSNSLKYIQQSLLMI